MGKKILLLLLCAVLISCWQVGMASAEVVIKVRALNPLNTKEVAVINYPLPKEISEENILKQKITYSLDHSEDEEPPKSSFKVSFNEEDGTFFIDDEVFLLPKEVVTLEVHVEDVWSIEKSQIENLRNEVGGILEEWEKETPEAESEEVTGQEETKEFAVMMKEEILDGLDKILQRQAKSRIIDVGVERHIKAYEDNMEELRQVQQDIVLLANLIQIEGQEEEGEFLEDTETSEPPTEEPVESQEPEETETLLESEENIEL